MFNCNWLDLNTNIVYMTYNVSCDSNIILMSSWGAIFIKYKLSFKIIILWWILTTQKILKFLFENELVCTICSQHMQPLFLAEQTKNYD